MLPLSARQLNIMKLGYTPGITMPGRPIVVIGISKLWLMTLHVAFGYWKKLLVNPCPVPQLLAGVQTNRSWRQKSSFICAITVIAEEQCHFVHNWNPVNQEHRKS